MVTILVTGANGQLGSELRELKDHHPFRFLYTDIGELDLTDASAIGAFFEKNEIDYLINCAAYTAVDRAEEEPKQAMRINRDAVRNMASACKKSRTRMIHISTDYVFPGTVPVPLKESDPVGPKGVYGRSKLEGEKVLAGNPDALIIRTSWLYSAFGTNFVKNTIGLMNRKEALGVVFDQVGSPTYAEDLASAILEIIRKTEEGNVPFEGGIYHYANEGVCSWYDFAVTIAELIRSNCKIKPLETKDYPTAAPRPAYSVLNKSRIKSVFSLEIPYWRDSLKKCTERLS